MVRCGATPARVDALRHDSNRQNALRSSGSMTKRDRAESRTIDRPTSDTENLLQLATEAGRAGAWEWDAVHERVSYTPSLLALFDLHSIGFDGTPASLAALIHPDDREALLRGVNDAASTGIDCKADVRALQPDGSLLWLHLRVRAVREADRLLRMIGTAVDIDTCKRAELSLREGEHRFATLFNASPLNVTVSLRETGQLLDVNEAFISTSGFQRDEVIGRTTVELGLWPSNEDREAVLGSVSAAAGVRNLIVHMRARGGEERIGCLTAEHISINGEPRMLTLFEDITARERAEAALRMSEQRLRLALRAANAGVWQMNMVSGQIFWSDEFRDLYGYDENTVPGRDAWAMHLHPDDREGVLDDWRTRMRPGTDEYRREFRILHPTRGLRWILALGHLERNEQGRVLSMTGISIDITRIKEVEQELREADERKNEFLAVLSHELRNPLAPLRNGMEILRRTQGTGAAAEQARVMMARQLEQMVHLIDDLLEVGRISRGKIELKRVPVDLTVALQHAFEVAKPSIDAAAHELVIEVPPGPLIVDADVTRLAQVFGNLLNNAAKYTNPGGHLRVTVTRADEHVSTSIRDDGIGIPADKLPKIFEMFAQVDNSVQRMQGGLGIGLSIAKRLVQMHGGTLDVRSEGLGKGAEFIVRLPLLASEAQRLLDAAPSADEHVEHPALRVLVADDNEDAAASLALVLEMSGHFVRIAHDGVEAVEIAEAFDPEVVVLDIGMPRLDGYEACRQLRGQPHGEDMLIIALTGWGQLEDRQRSEQAGFDEHLVKPADMSALEEMLRQRAPR